MAPKNVWKNPFAIAFACSLILIVGLIFYSCKPTQSVANIPFDVSQLEKINHRISQEQATALTNRYDQTRGSWSKKTMPASEAFNKRQVDSLLNQPGCVGIRIRYGIDDKGNVRLVLYGINERGKDISEVYENGLKSDVAGGAKQKGSGPQFFDAPIILENGQRCPQYCP